MSIRVLAEVLDGSDASRGTLLVLVAIANFADDDGVAFPSVEALAEMARITRRAVFRCLEDLVKLKELKVASGKEFHDVNTYHVCVAELSRKAAIKIEARKKRREEINASRKRRVVTTGHHRRPSEQDTLPLGNVGNVTRQGDPGVTRQGEAGVTRNRHGTVMEPSSLSRDAREGAPKAPTGHEIVPAMADDLTAEFAQWYAQFPLKKARKAAWKAYQRARKEASREVLLAAVVAYAVMIAARISAEGKGAIRFCKHPATWLNNGCWDDEVAEGEGRRGGSNTMEALRRMEENG